MNLTPTRGVTTCSETPCGCQARGCQARGCQARGPQVHVSQVRGCQARGPQVHVSQVRGLQAGCHNETRKKTSRRVYMMICTAHPTSFVCQLTLCR
jgi:hypothetical protein